MSDLVKPASFLFGDLIGGATATAAILLTRDRDLAKGLVKQSVIAYQRAATAIAEAQEELADIVAEAIAEAEEEVEAEVVAERAVKAAPVRPKRTKDRKMARPPKSSVAAHPTMKAQSVRITFRSRRSG